MIPWVIVAALDAVAWRFGFQTYVRAIGGPGWHRGRFGADSIYFRRCGSGERPRRLKAR